jgi:hypothetical protein
MCHMCQQNAARLALRSTRLIKGRPPRRRALGLCPAGLGQGDNKVVNIDLALWFFLIHSYKHPGYSKPTFRVHPTSHPDTGRATVRVASIHTPRRFTH